MIENKFETMSLNADSYQFTDEQLDQLIADKELSDTWDRYHLIGDVMRDEIPQQIHLDLSDKIAQAITKEPTILAPKASTQIINKVKDNVVKFIKPFGQIAIAASAAGLMILGVQQNVADNDTLAPAQAFQTVPFGGVADPVSFNYQDNSRKAQQQAFVEQQRRFQALLSDHQQQLKFASVPKLEVKNTTEEQNSVNEINNVDVVNKIEQN